MWNWTLCGDDQGQRGPEEGACPNGASVLIGRDQDADRKEKPQGDGGRDGRDVATSLGMPGAPGAGRGGKAPPLAPVEGAGPWDTWTSDAWSPGRVDGELLSVQPMTQSADAQRQTSAPPILFLVGEYSYFACENVTVLVITTCMWPVIGFFFLRNIFKYSKWRWKCVRLIPNIDRPQKIKPRKQTIFGAPEIEKLGNSPSCTQRPHLFTGAQNQPE